MIWWWYHILNLHCPTIPKLIINNNEFSRNLVKLVSLDPFAPAFPECPHLLLDFAPSFPEWLLELYVLHPHFRLIGSQQCSNLTTIVNSQPLDGIEGNSRSEQLLSIYWLQQLHSSLRKVSSTKMEKLVTYLLGLRKSRYKLDY